MNTADESTLTVATLGRLVGREFASSEWRLVDQARIDAFGACTGDHQFIHVDPARVRYRSRVLAAERRGAGRTLLRQEAVLEVEGQEKSAVVAKLLAMYVARL